jgi:AraC family transcriptional regulator of adaptative response/methylated-DNA-[protein]-cysteine methyltransferase
MPRKSRSTNCILTGMAPTPLGPMEIAATSKGVCLAEFTNGRELELQIDALRRLFQCDIVPGNNSLLDQLRTELAQYFAGGLTRFQVPLVYPGSAFQLAVWDALRLIPYGESLSYEALAHRLGKPMAVRAVGTANGQNRIAILIPCHRVVNKNGQLGGYGGGLWRKKALLELEQHVARKGGLQLTLAGFK